MLNSFRCLQHTLVDEHQVFGIKIRLRVEPGLTLGGDVGSLVLAGVRRFLRNNRLSGILFLQDEPECFRASAQIVQDTLPVALFIIARPGISV